MFLTACINKCVELLNCVQVHKNVFGQAMKNSLFTLLFLLITERHFEPGSRSQSSRTALTRVLFIPRKNCLVNTAIYKDYAF